VKDRGATLWHGPLPAAWRTCRFKYAAQIVGGQVDPTDERYRDLPLFAPNHMESGTGRLVAIGTADEQAAESGKYMVRAGDVLYSKIRPALRKVIVAPENGLCSADVYAVRPRVRDELDARFLFYLLLSEGFFQYSLLESDRVAMPKINREALGECPLVFPPIQSQRCIVDFLDRKTAAIDELIKKKERLIELLQEKRQALITKAVTKGLDPNVPMKDSGYEWIGGIPRHWHVAPTHLVARLESGHTPSRQHPEYWVPEECVIPWFSLADVWQLRDGKSELVTVTEEKISYLGIANSAARLLPAWTVIVSRTASVGFSGILGCPMATTQDFVNWICGPKLRPAYLLYVFRTMRDEFRRLVMGSTHQTIYMPDVARFVTPVPQIVEQDAIVDFIRGDVRRIDSADSSIRKQIHHLREYRQALISSAVTGQLDVSKEAV
jgi:type I restriction enzyme, S subunit